MHKQIYKIFDNLILELQQRLIQKGIHLVIKPAAKKYLIKKGYSEKFGARPLRRVIQNEIEHQIADGILFGEYIKGSVLTVGAQKNGIKFEISKE